MCDRKKLIPDGPRLCELSGMDEARAWGEEEAQDLNDWVAKKIVWSDVDPGRLLHGEPGTGKTLFARALAATCELPLIETSYAEWQRSKDGHMGDVLAAMHAVFARAKRLAPCILLIDEIDAVSSRDIRGHNHRWYTGIITALIAELNALSAHEGVIVLAAANYLDGIDPALLRAGRLDKAIEIPLPSLGALKGIIRFHLDRKNELADAGLGDLAVATIGMTGADVEKLVRDARRRARHLRRDLLLEDLFAVLGERVEGLSPDFLERIAIHEAGHATAAIVLEVSRNVNITLFHLGQGGASMFFDPEVEAITRKVVVHRIAVALAGRAAEDVLLGCVTAGAGGSESSDLGVANRMAMSAVAHWGLSVSRPPIWIPPEQPVSSQRGLRREMRQMLNDCYALALDLMRERKLEVRAMADALVKRRALAHDDIVAILNAPKPGPKRAAKRVPRKRA